MLRRAIALALVVLTWPLAVAAQETGRVWRIGFLSPYSADFDKHWRAGLSRGLRELGYVEGKNIVIEQRHAQGRFERLPKLAAELAGVGVDVFIVHGSVPAINAVR